MTEDEKERKKRTMKEAGLDGDKKLVKNARKLAEAGAKQQGQMRNLVVLVFLKNKKTAAAAIKRADDVDIDDLSVNPRARVAGGQRRAPLVSAQATLASEEGFVHDKVLVPTTLVPASMSSEPDQADYYESAEYNDSRHGCGQRRCRGSSGLGHISNKIHREAQAMLLKIRH